VNIITAHPILVTFGIGLAIAFVIGPAIGILNPQSVLAQHVFSGICC
jgi:uncharacterized membrane protein